MWNPLYKSLADQGEEVEATRRRQLDLANYRGPKWAEMAQDSNAQFWDYAGKMGPASAAAWSNAYTDPAVAALKNKGGIQVAEIEQGAETGRGRDAAIAALKKTQMEQAGAGARTAAEQAGAGGRTAAEQAGAGERTAAEQAGAGGRTDAEVKGRAEVARLMAVGDMVGAARAMEQLKLKIASDEKIAVGRDRTDLSVAQARNAYPNSAGGAPDQTELKEPTDGEWRQMSTGEWRVWNSQANGWTTMAPRSSRGR